MANNVQPIFHLPPFLSTDQVYTSLDGDSHTSLPDETPLVTDRLNQRCGSPWAGLRTRGLLDGSTIDFDPPNNKYGAIGSGHPKPAIPAKTSNFARLSPMYTAAEYHTPALSTTSDESSASSSSSRKVTFEPGVQLPTRSTPEQKADFKARAREMVGDEASTAIRMMLALALYDYCVIRVYRFWTAEVTETTDHGEAEEDQKTE